MQQEDAFLAKKTEIHIACHSNYTHKKHLESKCLRTESESSARETPFLRTSWTATIDYKSVCHLCEKDRDGLGDRTLVSVVTVERQLSIHNKAKELNEEAVLLKIMGHGEKCLDLIANDFRYHRKCLNRFMTNRKTEGASSAKLSEHDTAFLTLVSEISNGLLNEKHVYPINQLSKRYNDLLPQHGKQKYRTDRLKKRIFKHFTNDKIQVVQAELNECQLLFDSEDECIDDSLHKDMSLSSYH